MSQATAAANLEHQAAEASSRLAGHLALPHPGKPEAITHPNADGMNAGSATGTGSAGGATRAGVLEAPRVSESTASFSVYGTDVADYQGNVNWTSARSQGMQFAMVKATEGTYYTSPYFASQYDGSYAAGLIRGAYTFAIPSNSSGAAQADYFVAHGGGWSGDGHTLPGMLDIEFNPYPQDGNTCYNLTQSQMVNWVASFDNEYHAVTGRWPILYTNANWWNECTGGSSVANMDALDVANYGMAPSPLPGGWSQYSIWQYTDSNSLGYDGDVLNPSTSLATLAGGTLSADPSPSGSGIVPTNTKLLANQYVLSSNGAYKVIMQGDGNLVVYRVGGPALWATGTVGNPGAHVTMQGDGNLVVYSSTGRPLWASNTCGDGPSYAIMQNDGNFVVYTNTGRATWASGS